MCDRGKVIALSAFHRSFFSPFQFRSTNFTVHLLCVRHRVRKAFLKGMERCFLQERMQMGADVETGGNRFWAVSGFSQAIAEPEKVTSGRNADIIYFTSWLIYLYIQQIFIVYFLCAKIYMRQRMA